MELIAHLLIVIQDNMWNVDVAHIDQYSMLQKLNKLRYSCCLTQLRLAHSKKLAPRAYSWIRGPGSGVVVWVRQVHCCTLSLCHLGSETDDHHRDPNINTEIVTNQGPTRLQASSISQKAKQARYSTEYRIYTILQLLEFQMRQHLPKKQVSAVLFSVEKSSRIRCYCIHGLYFFFKFTAWKEVNLFCESYFIICPSPNHRCGCFQSVPPL